MERRTRALLQTYPALLFNLKIAVTRQERQFVWDHLGPITNGKLELYEDRARLMEEMPTRFVIGSDGRFGERTGSAKRYIRGIRQLRRILGTLNPVAAGMIAGGNARRLFPRK